MKKGILVYLVFVLTTMVCGRECVWGASTWARTYGGSDYESASIVRNHAPGSDWGRYNTANEDISTTISSVAQGITSLTSVGVGAAKSGFERALLPAVQANNLGGGISALGDIPGPSQFMSLNYSDPPEPVKKALTDSTLNSQGQLKILLGSLESMSPENYLSGESLSQFEQFQKTLQTATSQFSDLQTQKMAKIGA